MSFEFRNATRRGELLLGRREALQRGAAVDPHADAVAGEQVADLVEMGDDTLELGPLAGHCRHKLLMHLLRAQLVGGFALAFAVLHQKREHLAEQLGGRAPAERDAMRRIVVAGEQTPQPAVAQDRYRHGCRYAHVAQIFDVDRRHAAQHASGKIELLAAGAGHRLDGRSRGIDVGDQAQPIALVEHSGLARDVGGGVAQAQIGFQIAARQLGDHFARSVLIEAIDHDAIELGHGAQLARRHAVEGAQVVRLLQARDHATHHQASVVRALGDGRLALDDDRIVGHVHRQVAAGRAGCDLHVEQASDHVAHDRTVQLGAHGVDRLLAEDVVQRFADEVLRRTAQPLGRAAGCARYQPGIARYGEQQAERLD